MLKLGRRASGHLVTFIEIRVHLVRVKPGHISNPFGHSTRDNKESSPVLACTVRKLPTKALIAHVCLLLTGGRKFWRRKNFVLTVLGQGTGQRNV